MPRASKYPNSLQSANIFGERQTIAAVLTSKSIVRVQRISLHKEQLGLLLKTHFSLKKIIPKIIPRYSIVVVFYKNNSVCIKVHMRIPLRELSEIHFG